MTAEQRRPNLKDAQPEGFLQERRYAQFLNGLLGALTCAGRLNAAEPALHVHHVEDFTSDPLSHGWSLFGDAGLFQWNPSPSGLEVTWDSSRPNSYLELPLGTQLTRRDDFSAELDLTFHDLEAGVDPAKPGPFQVAFGFLNRSNAQSTRFIRGTATDCPNLVEFNYFPDTGWGSTVWPSIYSTNSVMNYRGGYQIDYDIFDLPVDVALQISLAYTASNETLTVTITHEGTLVGPVTSTQLTTRERGFTRVFTAFEVDTFALASYSDAGQPPPVGGSVLAHATVERIRVTTPPPPITRIEGVRGSGGWDVRFQSLSGWRYHLQASSGMDEWESVGDSVAGTDGTLVLHQPLSEAPPARFFRVVAER